MTPEMLIQQRAVDKQRRRTRARLGIADAARGGLDAAHGQCGLPGVHCPALWKPCGTGLAQRLGAGRGTDFDRSPADGNANDAIVKWTIACGAGSVAHVHPPMLSRSDEVKKTGKRPTASTRIFSDLGSSIRTLHRTRAER